MKKRRIRKSTMIPLVFTLYSVVVYAYFIPRTDASQTQIWMTLAVNVLIIVALWFLYRRKERMADSRSRDLRSGEK